MTEVFAFYMLLKGIMNGAIFKFVTSVKVMFLDKSWIAIFVGLVIFTIATYMKTKPDQDTPDEPKLIKPH